MNNLKQYDEYVKAYNELADKLDILGASDEIFKDLAALCTLVLNIDPYGLYEEFEEKRKSLA
ncbi:hypothetical protein [Romboutsia timonensis]|uniref:hypothetical protein n=1 Tax=Romboutsia timonensis TaxID=1776391 RepID=UPI002A75C014|nr:hypothetical protein [Romboutsia timonensis]MDY3001918.1 hypothetical protein [Romboutsia timonensis]MDY3960094.1 hypothetical protein [Romboutsia timonensis]